jgi:copper chaperone CopZ
MPTKLTIMGMTCTHCARTVEKALAGVQGVDGARVNYLKKEADVQGEVDVAAPTQAVERAGYPAALREPSNA